MDKLVGNLDFSTILLFLLISCSTGKSVSGTKTSLVDFVDFTGLEDLLMFSTEKSKPVFIDFYTNWCVPCKVMDKEVFKNPKTAEYLNENFVSVKINAEKGLGPEMAEKYFVLGYPSLIFVNNNGDILVTHIGSASSTLLFALGDQAKSKYNNNP